MAEGVINHAPCVTQKTLLPVLLLAALTELPNSSWGGETSAQSSHHVEVHIWGVIIPTLAISLKPVAY